MVKVFFFILTINSFTSMASADGYVNLDERYQPDMYIKYDISLEKEDIKVTVFKVARDEPHLNPLYFDVYFQCLKTKSYQKLERNFAEYESEQTYCGNEKPLIEKIDGKDYLSLPFKLAEPETGCPETVNRKEVFSIKQLKEYCEKSASNSKGE